MNNYDKTEFKDTYALNLFNNYKREKGNRGYYTGWGKTIF